jgi:protein-S-isoprenylcysteine O-methyltransferase Ste14
MTAQENEDHPDVVARPPLIFVGCAVIGTIAHFFFPVRVLRYPISLLIGVLLTLASMALAISAGRVLKAAGTNVRPDRPSLTVVKAGPYQFTRNPMYVSLCLLQLAIGFFLDGWVPVSFALVLALVLHFGVILREESYLERKFGEQYLSFKRRVRRWL